ncbi:hypothetical protein HYX12_02655, partial [Candidatus Woesearchaeota archaeon]|nr:hypothetical protein [Candidatus Woesearchaeota archaeon]
RDDIPIEEHGDDSVTYGNITWDLFYPVYSFGPDGLRFNNPQRLLMHWDEAANPRQGELGILYHDTEKGWRPIPCEVDYENHFLYTDLPGFSETTIYDCGRTDRWIPAATTAKISETGGCIGRLVALIVVLIVVILLTIFTVGGGFALLGAGLAGSSGSIGAGGAVTFTASIAGGIGFGTAFSVSVGTIGVVLAVAGGIVGGFAINTAIGYGTAEDSITFTPSCTQEINFHYSTDGGSGTCSYEGQQSVDRGRPITLQSNIQKCNLARTMFCIPCSIKCITYYK